MKHPVSASPRMGAALLLCLFVSACGGSGTPPPIPQTNGAPGAQAKRLPQIFPFFCGDRVFVANLNFNSQGGTGPLFVNGYLLPFIGFPFTAATTANDNPAASIAVDYLGDLFVPDQFNGAIDIFKPPYNAAPQTIPFPADVVAVDSSRNLYASSAFTENISLFKPPYTAPPVVLQPAGNNIPTYFAFDSSNDLFVVFTGSNVPNKLEEFAPPYTGAPIASFTYTYPGNGGIAVDGAGNLYIGDQGSHQIFVYNPPYTGQIAMSITVEDNAPMGIAIDRSNNLFVSNYSRSTLGDVQELAPPYTSPPVATITQGLSGPEGIAIYRPLRCLRSRG